MRWMQHWTIGRDCLNSNFSLPFQLGCVLPDWFERHPIHRYSDNQDRFWDRVGKIRSMKSSAKREWYLGTIVHYICDYCTQAHNEEYYQLYRHRVYEVKAQKLFLKNHKEHKDTYIEYAKPHPIPHPTETIADLKAYLETTVQQLHNDIDQLNTPEWFTDERVMNLDIEYAYKLSTGMISSLKVHEHNQKKL